MFSSTGTRPPFLPSDLSLSPHLLPSFRSTFYRHSPRSILSADNASTSLRFRGGGVALLAILHRFSSKDRYFRQGVNRYRESRLRSSSSKLMQHLTSRNIFLSRGSRACDRASFLPPPCLVLYLSSFPLPPSLPPSIPFSRSSAYRNYRYARCSTIACPSLSFLLDRRSWSETTPGWIYLHGKVSSHRYRDEKRSSPQSSRLCALPLPVLRLSVPSADFLRISLFFPASWQNIQKHMFRHLERRAMERKAPRIYIYTFSFSTSLSLSFSSSSSLPLASPSPTLSILSFSFFLLIFRCPTPPCLLPLYSERRAKLVNCGIIRDPKTIMVSRERASRSCGIPGGSFALMRLLSG